MADYNLGKAHGTVQIDYDGSGVRRATDDLDKLGHKSDDTGRKISSDSSDMQRAYAALTSSLRQLNSTLQNNSRSTDSQGSAFSRLVNHVSNVDRNTRTASSGLNTFTGRTKLLAAAVAIAIPGVAGLGVSLVALTGLAGVAAGALAAAGAAAATLAVGTAGISDVFKAAATDSKSAGSSAASSAKQQAAAAKAIEQAKRSLMDAEENLKRTREEAARAAIQAERNIVQAQRDLVSAQRDALRAQENLTRARLDATRQLEDMRAALTGGALDERQAILDVQKAQAELNKTLADPTANAGDKAQAVLNLEKQQFALEQTRVANDRLATDQAAAAAKGVAGADAVVSAQDAVRDSVQKIADAQQGVADAQDAARQQQVDSARAINDAIRSIEDAQSNLADAYASAADAATGGASQTADALSKISPNARALVKEILSLKSAWQDLKFSVQDKLFAGLADDVKPLAKIYLPLLKDGLGGIAIGFNEIIKNVLTFLKTSEATNNIRQIFTNTGLAVGNLSTTVRDLLAAFLDIAAVGTDFLPGIASGANNAAASFRLFISAARESGKLKEWMQGGIDAFNTIWQLLKNLASIIGTVFSAFDQEGGGALNTLTNLTGQIAKFLKSAQGQEALHSLGRILASIGGAVGQVFLSFLDVAANLLVKLEPLITAFADAAGTYLAGGLQVLGAILGPIASLLGFLGPSLGPVIAGVYAANKAVDLAKIAWGGLNAIMSANVFVKIGVIVGTLALLIIQHWAEITAALSAAWTWISDTASIVWAHIQSSIIDPIVAVWNKIVEVWNAIGSFFSQKWQEISSSATDLWNGIRNTFTSSADATKQIVSNFTSAVGNFFRNLPGQVWDFVKSLPDKFVTLGENIISGIVRGLGNIASAIWNKLKSIVSSAWNNVLDFFGINSPSKEGIWAGEMIGKGLAQGIAGSVGVVTKAAETLSQAVQFASPAFSPSSPSGMTFQAGITPSTPVGLSLPATTAATGTSRAVSAGATTIYVDNVTQNVAGNLDPTRPVEWRKAMVNMKDGLRKVENDYA